jgi:LysM repeat protein
MKLCFVRALPALGIALLLSGSIKAQSAYTMHTIAGGETLSALAKEYHTTVGDIMRLNGMHADSKLQIGEKIKIPATSQPIQREAEATSAPAKTSTPVTKSNPVNQPTASVTNTEALTHTVQSGESLYRISKTYNIPVEKLVSMNHLKNTGEIKVGQVLVVSDGTTPPAPTKSRTDAAPVTTVQQPEKEVQPSTEQPKKAPVTTTIPIDDNTTSLPPAAVKKQTSTPPVTTERNASTQTAQPTLASNVTAPKEGFFTTQFRQNVEGRSEETKTGAAMTFKSASGWGDKKFYVLMNDVPPGSIVKVANGNNVVYAKVLWSLGTQKENDGLDFRISTATAAALNITDEKFDVTVTYFQ